jgi:Xaa-Pro aminopeptidase
MTRATPNAARALTGLVAALLILAGLAAGPACKGKAGLTDPADKALAEIESAQEEAAAAAEAEANKPQPKPEPKINDENYVEIAARSILIREKYAEEPEQIEPEIEKVYEKLGVTAAEYHEFRKALAPAKSSELQKKVQEKMQSLANEYR